MFADEVGGSRAKKRQEEAKARRKQLKLEQQRKVQQEKQAEQRNEPLQQNSVQVEATTVTINTAATAAATLSSSNEAPSISSMSVTTLRDESTNKNNADKSAVQIANEQRQARHHAQKMTVAAKKIQSMYRTHRSNNLLIDQQARLLDQRLQDLLTLRTILADKGATKNYVPPPATCTALCRQLVFLCKSTPYKRTKTDIPRSFIRFRDVQRNVTQVGKIINLILIPALQLDITTTTTSGDDDEDVNPWSSWIKQSLDGRHRIQSLIRIAMVAGTRKDVDLSITGTCFDLIKMLLLDSCVDGRTNNNNNNRKARSKLSWSFMIDPFNSPHSNSTHTSSPDKARCMAVTIPYYAYTDCSVVDIISLCRYHLLYSTGGGGSPIPSTAEQSRESCISNQDRDQADIIFRAVIDVVVSELEKKRGSLFQRFVSELLTIPLLTWKVSNTSIQQLLSPVPGSYRGKMLLIIILDDFSSKHAPVLNSGDLDDTLCHDIVLNTKCNATPSQCLLANLLQLGRSSARLNGHSFLELDYEAASSFFKFIGMIVDAVPVTTFSSRESVVEWVSDGKGHHTPVVLSPVILEQCRQLVSDGAWVRRLFQASMADDELLKKTEIVLGKKNDSDRKLEKELQAVGSSSAASLAAKEARVDRNKRLWNSSAWAQRLTKGVSIMMKKNDDKKRNELGGELINATDVSRKLAMGYGGATAQPNKSDSIGTSGSAPMSPFTLKFLKNLCCVFGIVMARWGGGGGEDIVRGIKTVERANKVKKKKGEATFSPEPWTQNLLNILCFSTNFIRVGWGVIESENLTPLPPGNIPVKSISVRPLYRSNQEAVNGSDGPSIFYLFILSLAHSLIITDDTELHDLEKPIPLHQLRRAIVVLKNLLYKACVTDDPLFSANDNSDSKVPAIGSMQSNYFGFALIQASSKTMFDLYDRSSRRPLCVPKLWTIDDLLEKELRRCKTAQDYIDLLKSPVLRVCPYLVSFKRRLRLFDRIVYTNRVQVQGENNQNPFNPNPLKPGVPIKITRGRILEDGLATMNNLGSDMRQRLAIQYYNQAGTRETGIDAGGLFKEFWTDLCNIAFDPNYALFRVTEENCMYPNPSSASAHGSDHIILFEFLGRILGKALFESITVHPQFAHFFLSFLRGDYNYLHMLPDLSTMDAQLYNNLIFLKNYDGDAEDLCLTFTVAIDDFGGNREIPLIPNGSNVEVTNSNKHRYIGLVAKYYVVDRVKEQSEAFTRGLWEVIDRSWLKMFNEPELQVLISGATDGKIDVEDLRANCRYAGGFTSIDRTISRFWNVVASMNSKQQADLLRFVTSCERPPPLGFATLSPPFTIQRVGIMRDGDKLPASSTCFNVLKLPTYSSEKVMKERLLYAIESGAGFELT